jgi:hypothetical protein
VGWVEIAAAAAGILAIGLSTGGAGFAFAAAIAYGVSASLYAAAAVMRGINRQWRAAGLDVFGAFLARGGARAPLGGAARAFAKTERGYRAYRYGSAIYHSARFGVQLGRQFYNKQYN